MSSVSSSIPASASTAAPSASSIPPQSHLQLHPPAAAQSSSHSLHPIHLYQTSRDPRDGRDIRDSRDPRDSRDYDHHHHHHQQDTPRMGSVGVAPSALAPLNPMGSNILHNPYTSPQRKRKREGENGIELPPPEQPTSHPAQIANAVLRRRLSSPNLENEHNGHNGHGHLGTRNSNDTNHNGTKPSSSADGGDDRSEDQDSGDSRTNSLPSAMASPFLSVSVLGRPPGPTATTTLPLGPTPSRSHPSMAFSPGTPITPATPDTPGTDRLITTSAGVRVRADRERKRKFARRTKTGCMTCRKRKKKCDELKPHCNNCSKGGFECEGYVGKVVWGGHRPGENGPESARATSTPLATPIAASAPGVDDDDSLGGPMSGKSGRRGPPPPMLLSDDANRILNGGTPSSALPMDGPQLTPLNITHVLNDPRVSSKQQVSGGVLAPSSASPPSVRDGDLRLRHANPGPPVAHLAHQTHSGFGPSTSTPGSFTAPPGALAFTAPPPASGRPAVVVPPSSAATPSFSRAPFFHPHPSLAGHPIGYGHMPPPPPVSHHQQHLQHQPNQQLPSLIQQLPSPGRHHLTDLPSLHPYTSTANSAQDMAERSRMIAGEVYDPSAARLLIDRVSARVAVAQYNDGCDPRNGISAVERRLLFLRVLCSPEAREASHAAVMTGKEDDSASMATAEIASAASRLGSNVEVGMGLRCLYGYNLSIGDGSRIGDDVSILDPCRVRIGCGVVIGDRVIIAGEVGVHEPVMTSDGAVPARAEGSNGSGEDGSRSKTDLAGSVSGGEARNGHSQLQIKAETQSQSQSQEQGPQSGPSEQPQQQLQHRHQERKPEESSRSTDQRRSPSGQPEPAAPSCRLRGRPVVIEDDVWVGPGAIIGAGVRVGRGSWIGPGSVVTEDVPPGTSGMGNPFVPRAR